ncbi:DUF58 domain-containing protein [Halogeometricum sp. S1BR25-6]|uniref:DUF58 domain-containing protein n=1 Tax=Halogeometricum salsisoli TaxID=2950536 RepID=A0ABU2GJ57_9EURY|nr:DUF58 domain-containing protein [Halogeometricum sp. S1BR25-6]MDS0300298.1 DUF58 domain-containing protein [Halogeometricum sp. S1BR25-6]
MRVTNRYWAIVALAGVLTAFAGLLDRPAPLVGTAALGVLLLAHQARFVGQSQHVVDGLSVVQACPRDRVVKGEPFSVTIEATVAAPSPLDVELVGDPSVRVSDVGDDERRCRLSRGERRATTTMTGSGVVAGRVRFGPPELRLTDPFGLFSESLDVGDSTEISVEARAPRRLHVGAGGEALAVGYGDRDTRQLGDSQEPVEIREYAPGDEMRHIDWKATARLNQPHVRNYERKTTRRTVLVLDHGASMNEGPPGERKLDYARDAALLFLENARTYEDPVSLYAVGDDGVTVEREFGVGAGQYAALKQRLLDLTPTVDPGATDSSGRTFETDTARARRLADRLADEATPFERTLRPFVAERRAYVRRLDARPLFSAVRANRAVLRRSTLTVLVTDDSARAELRDAVKLARRGEGHVVVLLTPTALFEETERFDPASRYRRYRDFEEFRRQLANMDGVSAFEVGPGDKLEAILSAGRDARERTSDERPHPGGVR